MIVIDASVVVDLLIETPVNQKVVSRLSGVVELHVPHLIDVEFQSVLRRHVLRGELTEARAGIARRRFTQLPFHRYPHHVLADRTWQLRHSITMYDAQYIALAETLGLPLITADAKLASAHGHTATVESVSR